MDILFFLNDFPSQSQTFVLNQIVGALDRNVYINILATRKIEIEGEQNEIKQYKLIEKTQYLEKPPNRISLRLLKLIKLCIKNNIWYQPLLIIKALNFFKFKKEALSLQLLFYAIQITHRNFDIIHCQFGTLGPLALKLKQVGALSGKLVVSFRGYDLVKQINLVPNYYNELVNQADLFLPVSKNLEKSLIKIGGNNNKITVLHSGITLKNFNFQSRKKTAGNSLQLISVARLVEKKGIEYAIQALARYLECGYSANYTIVGDGPLRNELENLVGQLKIQNSVTFLGWRSHSQVLGLLKDADVLLAPSVTAKDGDQEGIPNVVKEAMALGVPVISTEHGGIPELIINKKTGILVPEKNMEEISNALTYVQKNIEALDTLVYNARKIIDKEYDSIKLNDTLIKLYKNLVK